MWPQLLFLVHHLLTFLTKHWVPTNPDISTIPQVSFLLLCHVFTNSKELTVYCLVCSLCLAFSPSSAPHPVLSVSQTTSNSTSPCLTGPLFCTPLPHSHLQEHLGNISSICIFQVPFPLLILFLHLICFVGSWRHFISPLKALQVFPKYWMNE